MHLQTCFAVTGYLLLVLRAAITHSIASVIIVIFVTILFAFGFSQAQQRVVSLELRNEQLHGEKSRREWELLCRDGLETEGKLCLHCTNGYHLGEIQDLNVTNRAVDAAVSCDHESWPASLHSSEMRSMLPTILCGDL